MKGVRFGVVTLVCVLLGALALLRREFEWLIPPPPANKLEFQPGEYLQKAVHQRVHWLPLSSDAFAEARRRSKPILLVIGAPWSRLARTADGYAFSNIEVSNLINQNFIPVRIDGAQQPSWLSTYLPVSRLRGQFVTGFQAWVLDSRGRLLTMIGSDRPDSMSDYNFFSQSLISAQGLFAKVSLTDSMPELAAIQLADEINLDQGSGGSLPSFASYASVLEAETNPTAGGFPERGLLHVLPLAWEFQLRTGEIPDLVRSLNPVLYSPMADIVRGGFFRLEFLNGPHIVDFDETTVTNAQMAVVLTEASLTLNDPVYRWFAESTFDMLLRDLCPDGLFAACRQGDESETERSATASFSPRLMRKYLDGDTSEWARKNLGLTTGSNPQMIPFAESKSVLYDPKFPQVIGQLRATQTAPPLTAAAGCLDVNGSTLACLIRCVRLWGDSERMTQLLDRVDRLDIYRTGNDVLHVQDAAAQGTYLGDYLAYADAQLQDYLATGRSIAFENGLAVLRRALERYHGFSKGAYLLAPHSKDPVWPVDLDVPEVLDDVHESCTAQAIRLMCDYGRLLGPSELGNQLLADASDSIEKYSDIPGPSSARFAGYFLAAGSYADAQCAFAVGPKCQELADQLARLRPNRLVAPVVGQVRPDLRGRAPGIYVASGAEVGGPYTVEQAAGLMPQWLQLGVTIGG